MHPKRLRRKDRMMKAKCVRCGRIHPKYRFDRVYPAYYLLWCKTCGTSMHEPVADIYKCSCEDGNVSISGEFELCDFCRLEEDELETDEVRRNWDET